MKVYMANTFTSIFPLGIIAKGEILGQKHIDALDEATIADMVQRKVLVVVGEDEDANAKSEGEHVNTGSDGGAKENPDNGDASDGDTGDGETGESKEAADSEDADNDAESDGEDDGEGSEEIDADAMDEVVSDEPEPAPEAKPASRKSATPKKGEGGKAK